MSSATREQALLDAPVPAVWELVSDPRARFSARDFALDGGEVACEFP
jgi:hypothetical protein